MKFKNDLRRHFTQLMGISRFTTTCQSPATYNLINNPNRTTKHFKLKHVEKLINTFTHHPILFKKPKLSSPQTRFITSTHHIT